VPPAAPRDTRTLRAASTPTEHAVLAVWRELLGRADIGIDEDYFALGGDSLSTLPLLFKLNTALGVELPLAARFAAPTVAGMAAAAERQRAGQAEAALDLVARVQLPDEIDPRQAAPAVAPPAAPRQLLLTGATGFLGAFLLRELLDRTAATIHCLVRAEDGADALRRVRDNLRAYGLWHPDDAARLRAVRGELSAPRLGLDGAGFDALADSIDAIVHNGGQVNFLAPYERLEAANVGGTREVLRLATRTRVKPVHLVSTLGVYLTEQHLGRTVLESDPPPDAAGQHGGYNQSKWVAEQLALVARGRGLPVTIHRPARITGDSRSGASNVGDYFNAWIKGCVQLGLAPALPDEAFDMVPVDVVARAIVTIALGGGPADGNYHYFNPRRLPIPEAVAVMREFGLAVREVPYADWRRALLAAVAAKKDNALAAFAGMFPERPDPREPVFDCRATFAAGGIDCPPADRALFASYLRHLETRGLFEETRR
jgi:thioester reductase-like protein